ncbi:MAG: class I SAM-dependent methyltransferase [Flavobacteriales bacterium]|nr:class I SAM-dependent methyltransferase [Flavobacteriales bacterium]
MTWPRPSAERIGVYYRSDNYLSHNAQGKGLLPALYKRARQLALRKKYRLVATHHTSGQLLDLGCGTGEFLAFMRRRGFLVSGVEPSELARTFAGEQHQLAVKPALADIPAREQFDVITLWHVLEHLPDLRATLKRIYASQVIGGQLIIAVPDRESWDADHYGSLWAAYDVPRHFWHFRRTDIELLLREHGYTLKRTLTLPMDGFYIALLSEQYRGRGTLASLVLGALKGSWSAMLALFGKRPGSTSVFVAIKEKV